MDNNSFYIFKFDKEDSLGKYVEFEFPSDVPEIPDFDNILQRFHSGELSKDEEKDLFDYLLANMENNLEIRKKAESVYEMLIKNSNLNKNSSELVFIGQYTMFLCYLDMKYNKDDKVKKGYEEMTIPPMRIYDKLDSDGIYSFGVIGLRYDVVTSRDFDSIFYYIKVFCHEMRHHKQFYDLRHGILNNSSFGYYVESFEYKDRKNSDCNYWFLSRELDADDYGYEKTIEIMKKFTPNIIFINYYTDMLNKHRDNKALAFTLLDDDIVFPTDVHEIIKLIEEINMSDKNKEDGFSIFDMYVEEFRKLGLIPNLFELTPDGSVKLLDENTLLEKYFHASEDEKEIYEKALKFYYSLDSKGIERYTLGSSENDSINLDKIRFIEKQLAKEEMYCKLVLQIKENPTLLVRGGSNLLRLVVSNIANEMILIRGKRVENFGSFLEKYNNKVLLVEDDSLNENTSLDENKLLDKNVPLILNKCKDILDKFEEIKMKVNTYSTSQELFNTFNDKVDGNLKNNIFNKNHGR